MDEKQKNLFEMKNKSKPLGKKRTTTNTTEINNLPAREFNALV